MPTWLPEVMWEEIQRPTKRLPRRRGLEYQQAISEDAGCKDKILGDISGARDQ